MPKIVYARLSAPKSSRRKTSVAKKRVGPPGQRVTIYTIDADSDTFGEDLTCVFKRNVAKARRENKRVLGYADTAKF